MNRATVLLIAASLTSFAASAGEFSVTPVRIFMTPRDRAVAITVTNEGSDEVVMQAEVYAWAQKADGSDDLTQTDDLILTPPILKLAPKSRQVVRLARLVPPPATGEHTYRMIVREVPEARERPGITMQVALAFSMPIFITSQGAKRDLRCVPERTAANTVKVKCENDGNAYAQIRTIEITDPAGKQLAVRPIAGYLLPNVHREFDVTRQDGRIPGGPVKVQLGLDDGTVQSIDATLPE